MATVLESARIEIVPAVGTPPWTRPQRVLFRFACAYSLLYFLPFQGHVSLLGGLPGAAWLNRMSRAAVEWIAAHIFHLGEVIAVYPKVNGSGDTTLDYIHNLLIFVAAILAALVWSILDRNRGEYRRLHAWLRIWLRFSLALTLYGYGFAKVFPLQFVPPGLNRLMEPLHDFSPMGLLWTFMGYSAAYTIFSGAAEVLSGTLLLFRRTTTLGALASAAVLLNIVMLNSCYDVPVKLYSSNLLFAALFLAGADLPRLWRVFVLNKPARPLNLDAVLFRSRAARIATIAVKTLVIGYFLFGQIRGGIAGYRRFYVNVPRPPLYGIWEVESFTWNGSELSSMGGEARWKLLVIERPQNAMVKMTDDSSRAFPTTYDSEMHRVTFTSKPDLVFTWTLPDDSNATLNSDALSLKLRKIDASQFLLTHRGFHWINERPFNR